MNSTPRFRFAAALTAAVALSVCSVSVADRPASEGRRLDVAMNGHTFSFEGPVNENGVPANGTPFIISGYIYPGGTFEQHGDLAGVLPDGSAEFPDKVLGTWICRGWHLQDGDAPSGPLVATTQVFDLDPSAPGTQTIVTNGIELAEDYVPFGRAITGGSGMFEGLTGRHTQVMLGNGFNVSGGFNTSFTFELRRP